MEAPGLVSMQALGGCAYLTLSGESGLVASTGKHNAIMVNEDQVLHLVNVSLQVELLLLDFTTLLY